MQKFSHPTDFDDKQRMRRFVSSPLTFIVLGGLVIMTGWKTWGMYEKWRLSEDVLANTRTAYENLEKRADFLDTKIDSLGTELGVEAEVRERFGVAKEGEGVIVVLSDDNKNTLPLEEDTSWWARVKGWFGGE